MLSLAGGWGYDNLGDEAILASYLSVYATREDLVALSVYPRRTMRAQQSGLRVANEWVPTPSRRRGDLLIAGGGYLNGSWKEELPWKLLRLLSLRADNPCVVHGVELRGLADSPYARLAQRLLRGAKVAVRDDKSAEEARKLGVEAVDVLPDSVSMLTSSLIDYVRPIPSLEGKVVINLLDIENRADSAESEVDLTGWFDFCQELVGKLDGECVGLSVGDGDDHFMGRVANFPIIRAHTVEQLVSVLQAARAVLSVRMHPALIASALGKPTISVPYCGKVSPVMREIGIEDSLLRDLRVDDVLERCEDATDHLADWHRASQRNIEWLASAFKV